MRRILVPREILAAEIRAGRVVLSGEGVRTAAGTLGAIAAWRAGKKLEDVSATAGSGPELAFPPGCCNCMRDGMGVRSIPTTSIVSRGVEYAFRFQVPHCRNCAATANRKRPGFLGMTAAFLAISVPVFILMLGFGAGLNNDFLILSGFAVAPALGVALPRLWMKLRRPKAGQSSRYQAVYVSAIGFDVTGQPSDITLTFENSEYADRFLALNKANEVQEV